MSVNGLNTAASGMRANQFRMDVTANNVANVNTQNFNPSRVATADSAYINGVGSGTRVAATSATYGPPRPGAAQMNAPASSAAAAATTGGSGSGPGGGSNVNMVTEMTNMRSAQNAYNVNAAVVRTQQDVSNTLMDIRG